MAHLEKLLGEEVEGKDGNRVQVQSLVENDRLGLYFSAHWCPPCRGFTPVLVDCYKAVKAAGKKLEIIFVSFDRDIGSCKEYYSSMPWLLLPFDSDQKDELAEKYGVSGIPALILLDPKTGTLVSKDGRSCVEADKNGDKFPWK
uniref:Thioredoxin domain-containing protein n=2 Tax=Arion vulgaris TaxID=1028688 RepID=A0A0B7BQ40_9EUPU